MHFCFEYRYLNRYQHTRSHTMPLLPFRFRSGVPPCPLASRSTRFGSVSTRRRDALVLDALEQGPVGVEGVDEHLEALPVRVEVQVGGDGADVGQLQLPRGGGNLLVPLIDHSLRDFQLQGLHTQNAPSESTNTETRSSGC